MENFNGQSTTNNNQNQTMPTVSQNMPPVNQEAQGYMRNDQMIQRKMLMASRISLGFVIAIFMAIVISLCVLVPKVATFIDTATATVQEVQDSYDTIINTVKDIDTTIQGINKIDFDAFAEAVDNLTSVINGIANIFK